MNEIATRNNIPKKFPDAILLDMRKAGILRSKNGPSGGYCLCRPASDVYIGQVIRILDWPLAPIRCASRTACDDCSDPVGCHVRHSMSDVRDAIAFVLDNMTLEQFAARDNHADKSEARLEAQAG